VAGPAVVRHGEEIGVQSIGVDREEMDRFGDVDQIAGLDQALPAGLLFPGYGLGVAKMRVLTALFINKPGLEEGLRPTCVGLVVGEIGGERQENHRFREANQPKVVVIIRVTVVINFAVSSNVWQLVVRIRVRPPILSQTVVVVVLAARGWAGFTYYGIRACGQGPIGCRSKAVNGLYDLVITLPVQGLHFGQLFATKKDGVGAGRFVPMVACSCGGEPDTAERDAQTDVQENRFFYGHSIIVVLLRLHRFQDLIA
jgi:hypothetical protein